jgi:hypothetical protein
MMALGRTIWAFPGGQIPLRSTGEEPEFTSRDELVILNAGDTAAKIALTVHHADDPPVGPYEFEVAARRVRRVRFNDLIFPEAIMLDRPFAAVLTASRPVAVQCTRLDSSGRGAWMGTMAFPL